VVLSKWDRFMELAKEAMQRRDRSPTALQAYLLGTVEFETLLRFQRRLHYEISGDPSQAALILCEHPPLITVGRHGSRAHILLDPHELSVRGWQVRWVNRAGGCWLHQPGQLAAYVLLPMDRFGLSVPAFLRRLGEIVQAWLGDFHVSSAWRAGGAWVGSRPLALMGCAVRNWVSYYGLCLNVNPLLDSYRLVRARGIGDLMTSLERERRGRIRPALARERFIERFQEGFGFSRLSLFTEHSSLGGSVVRSTAARASAGR
jgi:lipoyl(octanoyl) transferase